MKKLLLNLISILFLSSTFAQTTISSSPNTAIPDNDAGGATDIITITDNQVITDINVNLNINHTWVGDLVVTLIRPGTFATIIHQIGIPATAYGCGEDNILCTLDDQANPSTSIELVCSPNSSGTYVPLNPLSVFNGQNISGNWTLKVADLSDGDTGTLVSWSVTYNTPPLVNSIAVQGQGGVSTITTDNGTLQMEATVLPANAGDGTYAWSIANGTGSATIDASGILTANTNGTVTVTATANDASGTTGSVVITISDQTNVGIAENNTTFNIYPNPTTGILNFETNEQTNTIEIYNLTGQKVLKFTNQNTINISELTNGIYMAKIITINGQVSTHKIIKK